MNTNLTDALKFVPRVFDSLNTVIQEYGVYIFMGLVFLLIPFGVWTLSGGLRKKLLKGKPMTHAAPVIVIPLPGAPPQPQETFNPFPPLQDPPRCDCDAHYSD